MNVAPKYGGVMSQFLFLQKEGKISGTLIIINIFGK